MDLVTFTGEILNGKLHFFVQCIIINSDIFRDTHILFRHIQSFGIFRNPGIFRTIGYWDDLSYIYIERDRDRDRETERERQRERKRETDRERDRERQRERQREREIWMR